MSGEMSALRTGVGGGRAVALVRAHDLIACGGLPVANMTRRPGGAGGYQHKGAAAKAGVNRSIHGAGREASCVSCPPELKAPDEQ
jgi:hypothetical protein